MIDKDKVKLNRLKRDKSVFTKTMETRKLTQSEFMKMKRIESDMKKIREKFRILGIPL
jgi:hypothetical protein